MTEKKRRSAACAAAATARMVGAENSMPMSPVTAKAKGVSSPTASAERNRATALQLPSVASPTR